MATINVNTSVNVDEDVEVEVEDVLDQLNDDEIQQVIQWLKDNDFINNSDVESLTFPHQQFHNSTLTIASNYYLLTSEEQEIIEAIANKYK
jgi:hypothetical protein